MVGRTQYISDTDRLFQPVYEEAHRQNFKLSNPLIKEIISVKGETPKRKMRIKK
jgi:hypothetical protein